MCYYIKVININGIIIVAISIYTEVTQLTTWIEGYALCASLNKDYLRIENATQLSKIAIILKANLER